MDHLEDIQKYSPKADEAIVANMEKTYRLVLSNADSRTVAFGDETELKTVRENYVKKKLGVTDSDEEIDKTLKEIGSQMKGSKNRLTLYYLVAEHYKKLSVFK